MFHGLTGDPNKKFINNLKLLFVYCQMTNLHDLKECRTYFSLKFVEFLDLLCRVSLQYHLDKAAAGAEVPHDLEDKVFKVLEMLWHRRTKKERAMTHATDGSGRTRRRKKAKGFPELLPPVYEDSDEY